MPYALKLMLLTLYTSDADLQQRSTPEVIALFGKTALSASNDWYGQQGLSAPTTRFLVIVLGPGRQVRIVVSEQDALMPGEAAALVQAWSTTAPDVMGPVVLGMQYSLGPAPAGFPVPWPSPPARWLEAARAIGEAESLTVDDVALHLLSSEQGPVQ
jgi:hypothetical protein